MSGEPLTMLLFKGHPGTGKSSICRELSRMLKWPLIDKDDSKDILMSYSHGPSEADANALAYQIMLRIAQTQLQNGLSVILDSPLARLSLFKEALAIAPQVILDAYLSSFTAVKAKQVIVIECVCSDQATWQSRISGRAEQDSRKGLSHKPATWDDITALLLRYQGCENWTREEVADINLIALDTAEASPEQCCRKILHHLSNENIHVE